MLSVPFSLFGSSGSFTSTYATLAKLGLSLGLAEVQRGIPLCDGSALKQLQYMHAAQQVVTEGVMMLSMCCDSS
jgi:hypothetical protein